jgi:hypothetical protein
MKFPVIVVSIGTMIWVIALVISLLANASANQIWICVIGALLGLWGLRYTIRRGRREGI